MPLDSPEEKDEPQLLKIYETVIRLDERIKSLSEQQKKDSADWEKEFAYIEKEIDDLFNRMRDGESKTAVVREQLDKMTNTCGDLEIRLRKQEKEGTQRGTQLSIFWRILIVLGPIAISGLIELIRIIRGIP